jgi:hypothetical protein
MACFWISNWGMNTSGSDCVQISSLRSTIALSLNAFGWGERDCSYIESLPDINILQIDLNLADHIWPPPLLLLLRKPACLKRDQTKRTNLEFGNREDGLEYSPPPPKNCEKTENGSWKPYFDSPVRSVERQDADLNPQTPSVKGTSLTPPPPCCCLFNPSSPYLSKMSLFSLSESIS